ncbi:helicase-related protein [Kitasatospora aureofaciens]|uniref:Helicase C-terminal domain-containing protein n=1 Tax=Kitasatospora aureofaciens TaxID=1894 RepID=A0A1E7N1K9_KITAU|nr:helicase-related protein [Kitasatospora aureofaciens]OEV34579.1 hypothetical protein HS99_0008740 [Kitasatospora aureofaciens]GGV06902.1 hypothetical protein GCM10010502_72440 [Kitasatospora aureofaciens]
MVDVPVVVDLPPLAGPARRAPSPEFKAHTGDDGEECGILCNSRLLTEGIDVAAVDAVCFADPKSSVIDIVQAVGRTLRLSYRQGNVSWIIPVYLPPRWSVTRQPAPTKRPT